MKLGIDLSNVRTMSSRVVVPTGNYPVQIAAVEVAETKAKTGHYLKIEYVIQAGEHEGATLNDNINIHNPSEDATRIGLQKLKTIATVGGHKNPNYIGDTNELMGLKLNIYVEENPTSFKNKDGETIETTENSIKAFYEFNGEVKESSPKKQGPKAEAAPAPWSAPEKEAPAPQPEPAKDESPAPSEAPAPAAQSFPWMK